MSANVTGFVFTAFPHPSSGQNKQQKKTKPSSSAAFIHRLTKNPCRSLGRSAGPAPIDTDANTTPLFLPRYDVNFRPQTLTVSIQAALQHGFNPR